ncbi:hypothetical protein N8Z47_02070 [Salibacteraceae bacterium]|nr:hypothetical protein [Salibacteraceae bacterium]
MGWKTSLILIESSDKNVSDAQILKSLGIGEIESQSDSSFDECLNPDDGSIGIGRYNGNIIISDGYYITEKSLEMPRSLRLCKEEKELCKLLPTSEIVTVACHSTSNYHGYSLIQNGKKLRLKTISDGERVQSYGKRTKEEDEIYKGSFVKKKATYWKDDLDPEEDVGEEQMMEDFTFEMAKRRLGGRLDGAEGLDILSQPFIKYFPVKPIKLTEQDEVPKKTSWKTYAIIIAVVLLWQLFKRFF